MTGDGVAVVEMAILAAGELDVAIVIEAGGHAAIGRNRLDYCKVAIGNAQRFVGRGELNAVAYGELAIDFLVDADACESARIIGGKFPVRFLDRELVGGWRSRADRFLTVQTT